MGSVIKIVRREEKAGANTSQTAADSLRVQPGTSEIVRTIKSWITAARERRGAETDYAASFKRAKENSHKADSRNLLLVKNKIAVAKETCEVAGGCLTILLGAGLIFLVVQGKAQAQQTAPASRDSLTLDQAIDVALRNNHAVKIARLEVTRADEDILAAKTFRLPSLHAYTLVSGNLAKNELLVSNPAFQLFPGLGTFFSLNLERKPTAVFAASAIQPLTQQYRIGLHIKLERLSRDVAQAKLRQQRNETVDQVKKAYYAILQTKSALSSVREAVKTYQ